MAVNVLSNAFRDLTPSVSTTGLNLTSPGCEFQNTVGITTT